MLKGRVKRRKNPSKMGDTSVDDWVLCCWVEDVDVRETLVGLEDLDWVAALFWAALAASFRALAA